MENACAVSHEKTIEERLREEIYTLTNGGICEVAARNPSVMEYMRHWEERALKAEAALSALSHPEPVAQEAVAWLGRGEDNVSEVTDRQDIASQWESDGIEVTPLYATPPDSDAVRADAERLSVALLKVRTLLDVEYHDDGRIASVGHASSGLREMVHILDDTLSNQGSSSNGQ